MKIDVSVITRINGASTDIAFNEGIEDLRSFLKDFYFDPVDFKGKITNTGGILKLSGQLKTNYAVQCYRCLKTFKTELNLDISEDFVNSLDNTDIEVYSYQGGVADIGKALQDNIILELPMKQICSESCPGLCPVCGINLDTRTCGCTKDQDEFNDNSVNSGLEALKDFF
jgi:uncharacterized protein